MSRDEERITPRGDYQVCLEHSLVMAHLLEHAVMFLPMDSELWHRAGVELYQFSGWINGKINADENRFDARRHRRVP